MVFPRDEAPNWLSNPKWLPLKSNQTHTINTKQTDGGGVTANKKIP